jgi:hypothetical protein
MRRLLDIPPADLSAGQLATVEASSPSPAGGAARTYHQLPRPPPGIGHNRPPAELEPDDVLWECVAINAFVNRLLGLETGLSTTYYWVKKGWIPAEKVAGHLVASKRAIAQRFARGTGLKS